MAKGQSHQNRETKKPKKSKVVLVQAPSTGVPQPKIVSQIPDPKKK